MHTDIIIGDQFAANNNYWVMQVSFERWKKWGVLKIALRWKWKTRDSFSNW